MLARERWQIKTIQALDLVFAERVSQNEKHGDAMRHLPDGVGPDVQWLAGTAPGLEAWNIQLALRAEYESAQASDELTKMHIVREEISEAFECDGDSPEFLAEIIQVAGLCVQWIEYKLEDQER